jgi:hypothetical protein
MKNRMKASAIFLLAAVVLLCGCLEKSSKAPSDSEKVSPRVSASAPATAPTSAPAVTTAPAPTSAPAITRDLYFDSDIMPVLDRLGCSAVQCHGTSAGKGGLKFSLFGAQPQADYAALAKDPKHPWVKPAGDSSIALVKALLEQPQHQAQWKLTAESPEICLLKTWAAQGAKWKNDSAPQLKSIELVPARLVMTKGQSHAFGVKAVFSDGSSKDVTADALCRCLDTRVAKAAPCGGVTAEDYGDSAVVVSYLRHWALGRVLVPWPQRPDYSSFKPFNKIDELVLARLSELNIEPSPLCTDEEFLRRVSLDVIGTLPTAAEARAFLANPDPDKRAKLVDRLMQRPEFADCWSLKWGDLLRIKSEYPVNLWPNAVQTYHHWLRDCIARNVPYDQFVRDLLTATGSDFRSPPANYYRAVSHKDPQSLAESTALLFMGTRLECAHCHAHPSANWTPKDNLAMAAFFGQVQYKLTQEWKEEVVYVSPQQFLYDPADTNPKTRKPVPPRFLGSPKGAINLYKEKDLRVPFARWLTAPDNPYFARNIVNRVWFWLMGRGIIQEPDDIRPTNPPQNPELLAYLESELVSHKFDLRHIYRLILTSRTYQLSWRAGPSGQGDDANFSHRQPQRLSAEQLLDAIGRVTETSEPFRSQIPEPYTVLPDGFRAGQLFDGSISVMFLELFGRPTRDTAYESERDNQPSMRQAMHMLNSLQIEGRLGGSPRLTRLAKEKDAHVVEELYLAAFSRLPAEAEKAKALEYLDRNKKNRTQAIQDLLWAIFNTKEFLFNH